jgi:hypothetical protein
LIETYYPNTKNGERKLKKDERELKKMGLVLKKKIILKDEKNQTFIKALWQPVKNNS